MNELANEKHLGRVTHEDAYKKILDIKNLSVIYKTDEAVFHAVNSISISLGYKETLGLVGETGAGKTTTALAIIGLLPERTGRVIGGEILFKGTNLLSKSKEELRVVRGNAISMIFQDPMTSLNPLMTVGDQILEVLEIHNDGSQTADELNERVDELFRLVGIQPQRKGEYPNQFSGGMKQRVVIAMALACNPELILADEPTTALDVTIQAQVLDLMAKLKMKIDTSIIMITHDMGVVADSCDKVAIMYAGEIIEFGPIADIFESPKHHPYTEGLFGSIPDLESRTKRLSPIDGLMPDPINLPSGCFFHPRCRYCKDICKEHHPKPYTFGEHVIACHLFSDGGE